MTYDIKQDSQECCLCGREGRFHTHIEWIQHRRIHGNPPCPSCSAKDARITELEQQLANLEQQLANLEEYLLKGVAYREGGEMTKGTKRYHDRMEAELTRLSALEARCGDVEELTNIIYRCGYPSIKTKGRARTMAASLMAHLKEGK